LRLDAERLCREARSRSCSRWAQPYPRGRCGERGYLAQRPRAGRGLSALM